MSLGAFAARLLFSETATSWVNAGQYTLFRLVQIGGTDGLIWRLSPFP